MKLIYVGDIHFIGRKPVNRKDSNYLDSICSKVQQVISYAKKHNIRTIVQAGDLFDSANVNHAVVSKVAKTLLHSNIYFYCVAGQHDLHFHNLDNPNTPLKVLEAAGVIEILGRHPTRSDVNLYGCSWGEEIPEIVTTGCNILVIHRMIIPSKNEKIFDKQEDFTLGNSLLEKHNFDFILSGDNHNTFECRHNQKLLLNAGSIMRSTIAQVEHRPCFYVIDTETTKYEKIFLDVKEDILNLEVAERENVINESLMEFVSALKINTISGMDYKTNVNKALEVNNVPFEVSEIISEVIEKAEI